MGKKTRKLAAQAEASTEPVAPTVETPTPDPTPDPVPAMSEEEAQTFFGDVPATPPVARVTLPARPIRTVATNSAASSAFKGVGHLAAFGIPPGLRRNEFQDRLLARNAEEDMRWDDDRLAAAMDAEHPSGGVRIADRPELVAVIRKFFNAGKHGKQQVAPPEEPSVSYGKPAVRVAAAK